MPSETSASTPAPRRSPAKSRNAVRLIGRERLLAQLLEARRQRCVVVQGPAGSGKTALMDAWRQALVPLGFEQATVAVTAADNEPAHLMESLAGALARIDPVISHEAAQSIAQGADADAIERIVIALAHGVAQHGRELVLVLDDLQNLEGAGALEALQWLLDYSPAHFHLALVSRNAAPLSLARLRAQGLVLELDQRDLRFTQEETAQYLQAVLGEIGRRESQRMHELTDGWVAGLQLLAHQWRLSRKSGPGTPFDAQVYVQNEQAFAAYFEREVLSRLSAEEVNLLVRAAACNRFCAPLCTALSGGVDTVAEATMLLSRLAQQNLFVTPVEASGPENWYQLNPLLRETLRGRLSLQGEAERTRVHAAAWHWLREHGHLEEAVQQAVLAGEAGAAADLVASQAQRLVASGQPRALSRLLKLLPPQQVRSRLSLRQWSARMQMHARDLEGAQHSLVELDKDIGQGDVFNRYMLDVSWATLAVQRDDTEGAMRVLPSLLVPPPQADAHTLGARNNLLSWLYMHRGDYEQARRIQLEAKPLLLEDGQLLLGTSAGTLQGRCLVGLSYVMEGQMKLAERAYRDVIHDAERGGSSCAEPGYLATALLGEVLYEINDADGALALLEPKVDLLERVSIPDSVWRMMGVLSSAHWLAGRRLEAFAYLERLEDYGTRLGLDRLLAFSLCEQMQRHLQLSEFEKAEPLLARLDALQARHEEQANSALASVTIVTRFGHLRWRIMQGDFEGAALRIGPLIALCEARGRHRLVACLQLIQATVEASRGREQAVRERLVAALRSGQRLGLVRSLLDTGQRAMGLIRQLAGDDTLDPVLKFYVDRLLEADRASIAAQPVTQRNRKAAAASAASPLEKLSEREIDVLNLLAQALPSKKIAKTLDMSYQTVKWHLKNIYFKLGVGSRDEAVARVRDLEKLN
ncbi:MAG: AAA family ATPase [Proteobacteria bacterium]|nr:AAA family ATPase [Pseudomonadota bacterium]